MCQLVTVGIPRALGAALPELSGSRDGFTVTSSRNPHLATIFPATDLRLDVTIGGCSCGLIAAGRTADTVEARRRRYEKQGWSRAKIDRALETSAAAQARDHGGRHARRFRDGVLALLGRTPSIRVFVHMYDGDFSTELVTSRGAAKLSRAEYAAANGAIPEDTLVEIS